MNDLAERLDKLAGRLMATTEHHQYAQLVLEAAASLRSPEARPAIIEECAAVCDATQRYFIEERLTCATGADCARAIRALLQPPPQSLHPSQEKP